MQPIDRIPPERHAIQSTRRAFRTLQVAGDCYDAWHPSASASLSSWATCRIQRRPQGGRAKQDANHLPRAFAPDIAPKSCEPNGGRGAPPRWRSRFDGSADCAAAARGPTPEPPLAVSETVACSDQSPHRAECPLIRPFRKGGVGYKEIRGRQRGTRLPPFSSIAWTYGGTPRRGENRDSDAGITRAWHRN